MKFPRIILCLILIIYGGFLSNCKTIENTFKTVNVSAGGEISTLRFYTRSSSIQKNNPFRGDIDVGEGRQWHSDLRQIERGFYTVSLPVGRIPVIERVENFWSFLRFFRYSATFSSPKVFRGSIYNYPDDGRQSNNIYDSFSSKVYRCRHP